jgi:hypothetical protein
MFDASCTQRLRASCRDATTARRRASVREEDGVTRSGDGAR